LPGTELRNFASAGAADGDAQDATEHEVKRFDAAAFLHEHGAALAIENLALGP
jgi:hypothetical protein